MREAIYIKIEDIIKIINKAEDKKIISPRAAEELIYLIYEETDVSKYKRP